MPKGDGQQGKRRGAYGRKQLDREAPGAEWSDGDRKMYRRLLRSSSLKHDISKEILAARIVEADRQARALDAITVKTGDDHRALSAAHDKIRKSLESLRLLTPAEDEMEAL